MSDSEDKNKPLISVEKASSGRSKCKITGEKIEAGELRVGVEGYMSGRVVQNWIKPSAFMEHCQFEYSPNNRARCKKTGDPLNKDEVRFIYSNNGTQKAYLKPEVVAEVLDKVLKAAKFDPTKIQGIDSLEEDDQKKIKELFKDVNFEEELQFEDEGEEKKSPKKAAGNKKAGSSGDKKTSKRKRKSESESTEADDSDKPLLSNKKRKVSNVKKDAD